MGIKMARSTKPPAPAAAEFNAAQARAGVQAIKRRIADLQNFDISRVEKRWSAEVKALQTSIDETLERVFGRTTDYNRYSRAADLDHGPLILNHEDSPREVQEYLRDGIAASLALLNQAVRGLTELLADDEPSNPLRAYENLDLHPEIARAASELYRDEHYANAIEDAVKALNALVRLRSGKDDLDGMSLMQHVFSPNKPVLRFNALADQSDKDEQQGFMMMFAGAVAGLRNPRSHRLIKDDAERALEFIAYVSLLAKLLDGAERV